MDELVQHCMRELSFDGDLGCDISRLAEFINDFYTSNGIQQTFDEAFHSYVWSIIVQQSTIHVGLVPEESAAVFIAPQPSQLRKAHGPAKKKKKPEESDANDGFGKLEPIDEAEVRDLSLSELKEKYGDSLRVATDHTTSFMAITGSHIRSSKLTPMVYTTLQFVTRGRDKGVTTVELSRLTGYDPKTIHYLVRVLSDDLDLVKKIRTAGSSLHLVIHNYFWERSAEWQAIHKEEQELHAVGQGDEEDAGAAAARRVEPRVEGGRLKFEPIDASYLSSAPLVQDRLIKLLKHATNHTHLFRNLVVAIGCLNPTPTDRRFFLVRVMEMMAAGIVEKVHVPNAKGTGRNVCLKLIPEDKRIKTNLEDVTSKDLDDEALPMLNLTLHKQIVTLVDESGTEGIILADLSDRLGNFDTRTIEHLLYLFSKNQPPAHLADQGCVDLMENYGRERHHRYYTVASYVELLRKENIEDTQTDYAKIPLDRVGEFASFHSDEFYSTQEELRVYADTVNKKHRQTGTKKKFGRVNPLGPDGRPVKGRPRKEWSGGVSRKPRAGEKATKGKKRKVEEADTQDSADAGGGAGASSVPVIPTPTPRRGRPPKKAKVTKALQDAAAGANSKAEEAVSAQPPAEPATPVSAAAALKKRGRAKKTPGRTPVTPKATPGRKARGSARKAINDALQGAHVPEIQQTEPSESGVTHDAGVAPEEIATRDVSLDLAIAALSSAAAPPAVDLDIEVSNIFSTLNDVPQIDGVNGAAAEPSPGSPVVSRKRATSPADATSSNEPQSKRSRPADSEAQEHTSIPTPAEASGSTLETELPALPQSKGSNSRRPPKRASNISGWRREKEFFHIIKEKRILNLGTKEVFEAHLTLLESLANSGVNTSTPVGTTTDKRTVTQTVDRLEAQGLVKQIVATITSAEKKPEMVRVAYMPEVTDDELSEYLGGLEGRKGGQPVNRIARLAEHVPYKSSRGYSTDMKVDKAIGGTVEKLSELSAEKIRRLVLTEGHTAAQLYGYLIGRFKRAQELHLFTLHQLTGEAHSEYFVSIDQRIIATEYFNTDLPIGTYCSVFSFPHYDSTLEEYLRAEENRSVPVKNIPPTLHNLLQIGKARTKSKLDRLLEILIILDLITPLNPSESSSPTITCEPDGNHPATFDIAPISPGSSAPLYCRFNESAPLFGFAQSSDHPPYLGDLPVATMQESVYYWQTLQAVSDTSVKTPHPTLGVGESRDFGVYDEFTSSIRRHASWVSDYHLSNRQYKYLKSLVDSETGNSPLNDPDSTRFDEACAAVVAPEAAVRAGLEQASAEVLYLRAKAQRRALKQQQQQQRQQQQNASESERPKTPGQANSSLAAKATEMTARIKAEWDAILRKVHPNPQEIEKDSAELLERLRNEFLKSSGTFDREKLAADIRNIVSGLDVGAKERVRIPALPVRGRPKPKPVVTSASNWLSSKAQPRSKTVEDLITQQSAIPRPTGTQPKKKKKKGKKKASQTDDAEPEEPSEQRRYRFPWDPEYDELARDAAAVISVRCRGQRIDWSPVEQVFPAAERNSVRQRVVKFKTAVGGASYLQRLEDAWAVLWEQYRGTEALPDPNPENTSDFDLAAHITFLRKHIDKHALHSGVILTPGSASRIVLPSSVASLEEEFEIHCTNEKPLRCEFMFTLLGDEPREKLFLREPLAVEPQELTFPTPMPDPICVAEAAIKMVASTPKESFDADKAEELLDSVGKVKIDAASKSLQANNVMGKVSDQSKPKPGRGLRYQDWQRTALVGPYPTKLYRDACDFEEDLAADQDEWKEWSLLATNGSMAAFLELVSQDKVDVLIDYSGPSRARIMGDGNSKRIDDDSIELALSYRLRECSALPRPRYSTQTPSPQSTTIPLPEMEDGMAALSVEHGFAANDRLAACKQQCPGAELVDCKGCLEIALDALMGSLGEEDRKLARRVARACEEAGAHGITKAGILALEADPASQQSMLRLANLMCQLSVPVVFWVGYGEPVLIACSQLQGWCVKAPPPTDTEQPAQLVLPRRWFDISGQRIDDLWSVALKAVMGWLWCRPGMSEYLLRSRLRNIYDRQEIRDVLQSLVNAGLITRRFGPKVRGQSELVGDAVGTGDETEEKGTYWSVVVNPPTAWYRAD